MLSTELLAIQLAASQLVLQIEDSCFVGFTPPHAHKPTCSRDQLQVSYFCQFFTISTTNHYTHYLQHLSNKSMCVKYNTGTMYFSLSYSIHKQRQARCYLDVLRHHDMLIRMCCYQRASLILPYSLHISRFFDENFSPK